MKYEFRFYKEEYYNAMIELARKSYAWEVPAVPISRCIQAVKEWKAETSHFIQVLVINKWQLLTNIIGKQRLLSHGIRNPRIRSTVN